MVLLVLMIRIAGGVLFCSLMMAFFFFTLLGSSFFFFFAMNQPLLNDQVADGWISMRLREDDGVLGDVLLEKI